jgi:NAD(P)H-hydrate repair Nnr-like enzyme with NAD(P)H-hydrate epimerase domain
MNRSDQSPFIDSVLKTSRNKTSIVFNCNSETNANIIFKSLQKSKLSDMKNIEIQSPEKDPDSNNYSVVINALNGMGINPGIRISVNSAVDKNLYIDKSEF